MTWLLASVSCNIPGIIWDKHQQTSLRSNSITFVSDNHVISAVVHWNASWSTNKQRWTNILHIVRRRATLACYSYRQQDSSWVLGTCWLLLIPFWHDANYIFLRTSHFFSLSSSSSILHQKIMDTQPPQPGERGSKSSQLVGATFNT